jgi:hypothetical protein
MRGRKRSGNGELGRVGLELGDIYILSQHHEHVA